MQRNLNKKRFVRYNKGAEMAKSRKDNKGRAIRKGESQRTEDMRYVYTYTDPFGKRRYIYANDLRKTTYANYKYMYDHFVREEFGRLKIGEIKYSDVLYFYYHLMNEKNLQLNTLETIHTVLHPTFQLAVRDAIIRINPSDGVMAQVKKKPGRNHGVRHALTLEQQRAFIE